MLQVKFRGKRIDTGVWVYGNLQVPTPPFDKYMMYEKGWEQIQVITESVGQFVFLNDYKDRNIYEGDILIHNSRCPLWVGAVNGNKRAEHNTLWLVKRFKTGFCLVINNDVKFESQVGVVSNYFFWNATPSLELIGNIHDNPELLINGNPK